MNIFLIKIKYLEQAYFTINSHCNIMELIGGVIMFENVDWLVNWPKWLRWIVALPFSLVLPIFFKLLSIISLNFTGVDTSGFLGNLLLTFYDCTIGIALLIYFFASIVPDYKKIAMITISIILGIIFVAISTYSITSKPFNTSDLVFYIAYDIVSLISIITMNVLLFKDIDKENQSQTLLDN